MLKKIHFAQPSIKYSDYLKHERNHEKLKRQISNGSARLAMMQAARDVIVRKEKYFNEYNTSKGSFGRNIYSS